MVKSGVEPQTETVWRQGTKYNVPRIVFVNKMDATGADFNMAVSTLHSRLAANAEPVQIPIGVESNFRGIIDIIEEKHIFMMIISLMFQSKKFRKNT